MAYSKHFLCAKTYKHGSGVKSEMPGKFNVLGLCTSGNCSEVGL
jgi:hypothetical protein